MISIDAAIPAPFGIIPERTQLMKRMRGKEQEKSRHHFGRSKDLAPGYSAVSCCQLNSESIIPFFLDYELEFFILIVLLGQRSEKFDSQSKESSIRPMKAR